MSLSLLLLLLLRRRRLLVEALRYLRTRKQRLATDYAGVDRARGAAGWGSGRLSRSVGAVAEMLTRARTRTRGEARGREEALGSEEARSVGEAAGRAVGRQEEARRREEERRVEEAAKRAARAAREEARRIAVAAARKEALRVQEAAAREEERRSDAEAAERFARAVADKIARGDAVVVVRMRWLDDRSAKLVTDAVRGSRTLVRLQLSEWLLREAFLVDLAEAVGHCPTLTALSFARAAMGDHGTEALLRAASTHLARSLEELDLECNGISDDGARVVANAVAHHLPALKLLNLAHNHLGDKGALELARMLTASKSLTKLNVSKNTFSRHGLMSLADGVASSSSLKSFSYGNPVIRFGMSDRVVPRLARAIETNKALEELNLSHNRFTDHGIGLLAAAISRSRSLKRLDVGFCARVTNAGAVALAEAVRQSPCLEVLDLDGVAVSDTAAIAFAEAVRATKLLRRLVVRSARLGAKGVFALKLLRAAVSSAAFVRLNLVVKGPVRFPTAVTEKRARNNVQRCTFALLGHPLDAARYGRLSPQRFILDADGDHAIWSRVMRFSAVMPQRLQAGRGDGDDSGDDDDDDDEASEPRFDDPEFSRVVYPEVYYDSPS